MQRFILLGEGEGKEAIGKEAIGKEAKRVCSL